MAKIKAGKSQRKPPPSNPKALARKSDPETSKRAAGAVAASLAGEQKWAVECVSRSLDLTARELAKLYCPDDPRRIGRRLPECEKKGLLLRGQVRVCTVSGKKAATWYTPKVQGTLF